MTRLVLLLIAAGLAFPAAGEYAPAVEEWNQPVEPFRVIGNVYYVGARNVSAILITTPEGHILIDTGFVETVPLIEASVKKLGFRMEDIRIAVASHAHYDHAGGLAAVKKRTGAAVLMNPGEVEQFARGGKNDFAFGDKVPFPPVVPEGLLSDGQRIELGGIALTAHFTPGHTKGCTSYSMEVVDGDRSYDLVYACSLTTPGYQLVDNERYPGIVEDLQATFGKLRSLPCDVFLAGHGWEFGLPAKREALDSGAGENPFIDPAAYRRFLDRGEAGLEDNLRKQTQ